LQQCFRLDVVSDALATALFESQAQAIVAKNVMTEATMVVN